MVKHIKSLKSKKYQKKKKITKHKKQIGGQSKLQLQYGNIIVNGQQLTKEQTNSIPNITVNYPNRILLIMLDPDAPNGQGNMNNKTFVHLVQIYENGKLKKTLVPYYPPTPPKGIHRYITYIYQSPQNQMYTFGKPSFDYYKTIKQLLNKPLESRMFTVSS